MPRVSEQPDAAPDVVPAPPVPEVAAAPAPAEPVVEAPVLTDEEKAVVAAAEEVAAAKRVLDEATSKHQAAVDAQTAVLKAQEPVPDPTKHVFVDFGGGYALIERPKGFGERERTLIVAGANVEHVDDDPTTGIWRYRKM